MSGSDNRNDRSAESRQDGSVPHQTLEVEIINPDGTREKVNPEGGRRWRGRGNAYMGGTVWNFAPMDNTGCLSAILTCFLFLICLGQYGALAGIAFLVFHTIGSVIGSVQFARSLMRGQPINIWVWRVGNWVVSFFLVALLSGKAG